MRIAYIGNFELVSVGEPEIAKSFESLGHEVVRYQEGCDLSDINVRDYDLILFAKLRCGSVKDRGEFLKNLNIPSVCWLFDLYWGLTADNEL